MWPCCSFIHPKAQCKFAVYFSPPPVRIRQLRPMAGVFNSLCVVFTTRFGFAERFRSWDTKLATGLSFTLPVPLANAWPTGIGKNQPSNISQDLCLGIDNNFITSRRKAWNTSLMLFFQRGCSSSNRKHQAWENSSSGFTCKFWVIFINTGGLMPGEL